MLLKRLFAVASSMLMTAGTTPAALAGTPMYTHSRVPLVATGISKPARLKPTPARTGSSASGANVVTSSNVLRTVQEYHYAVSQQRVAPVWQDPSSRKEAWFRAQRLRARKDNQQQRQAPSKEADEDETNDTGKVLGASAAVKSVHNSSVTRTGQAKQLASREGLPSRVADLSSLGRRIASLALHLVGSPYRYGGESRNGFDCSGFVQYVYRKVGMVLPRTSYEQFQVGTTVLLSQLKPGDLVFFSTDSKGPSHVAIYVGNGLIVQALNSRTGVVVSRLSQTYYRTHYYGAKRV